MEHHYRRRSNTMISTRCRPLACMLLPQGMRRYHRTVRRPTRTGAAQGAPTGEVPCREGSNSTISKPLTPASPVLRAVPPKVRQRVAQAWGTLRTDTQGTPTGLPGWQAALSSTAGDRRGIEWTWSLLPGAWIRSSRCAIPRPNSAVLPAHLAEASELALQHLRQCLGVQVLPSAMGPATSIWCSTPRLEHCLGQTSRLSQHRSQRCRDLPHLWQVCPPARWRPRSPHSATPAAVVGLLLLHWPVKG